MWFSLACQDIGPAQASDATQVHAWDMDLAPNIDVARQRLDEVELPRAVFVGEVHDRLPYHVNQLAVIAALRTSGAKVAVGLEMVQVPFQSHLDDFVAGDIDWRTMLERTEYFTRWRYDPRLYQPIFDYARRHDLPLVALNASRELTDRIRETGIDGLDTESRAQLPPSITPPAPAYRRLLEAVYRDHADLSDADLDRFIDVQLAWDESMAQAGARFLQARPDHVLVVLAGVQHVAHGHGVPARLRVQADVRGLVVLSEAEREDDPDSGDIFLPLANKELAASGRMGVIIRPAPDGAIVGGFSDDSPARQAGMQVEDSIVDVDGRRVSEFADLRLALFDKAPGDTVRVVVEREGRRQAALEFPLY